MRTILFILALACYAFGADIIRYVNTASSGGDGTTNNTTGATAAYATLSAAEAGLQQDLTDGGGDNLYILCSGGADNTACVFDGWTTSATNFVTIKPGAGQRHAGAWSTSVYRLDITDGTGILIDGCYNLHIEGMQISVTYATEFDTKQCVRANYGNAGGLVMDGCIIRGVISNGSKWRGCSFENLTSASANQKIKIQNCAFLGTVTGSGELYGVIGIDHGGSNAYDCYVYNCTFNYSTTGTTYGVYHTGTADAITVKNCGFVNVDDALNGTITAEVTNSETGPTFASGESIHLASNDVTWLDEGTDLSADAGAINALDIDSAARGATWDIGADEYTSEGVAPCDSMLSTSSMDTTKVWADAFAARCSLVCDTGDIIFQYAPIASASWTSGTSIASKLSPYLATDTTGDISPSTDYKFRFIFSSDTGTHYDTTGMDTVATKDSSDTSEFWLYDAPDPEPGAATTKSWYKRFFNKLRTRVGL